METLHQKHEEKSVSVLRRRGRIKKGKDPLKKKDGNVTAQKMTSCSSSKLGHGDDENDVDYSLLAMENHHVSWVNPRTKWSMASSSLSQLTAGSMMVV